MAAEAGFFPWSKDYATWSSRKKADNKATYYRGSNKTFGNMHKSYPTRPIRDSLTGNVYLMPKQDYTELINKLGINQNKIASKQSQEYITGGKKLDTVQTPTDYIDYAFNTPQQKKNITTTECDSGHIRKLAYNPLYKLLMVTFWNNTKCVFFNLPANLAATLIYCMENNVIHTKSLDFAVRIVRLGRHLQDECHEYIISKQIIRSGTSIGANVRESHNAQSSADFISKLTIALKEADETQFWLEVLKRSDIIGNKMYESLNTDVNELIAILTSIIKTTKTKKNNRQDG